MNDQKNETNEIPAGEGDLSLPLKDATIDQLLALLEQRMKETPTYAWRDALSRLSNLISQEAKKTAESLGEQWANTIRTNGAAMVSGKIHPKWLEPGSESLSTIKEPGFNNLGHIGVKERPVSYHPLGEVSSTIFMYGSNQGYDNETNYMLISRDQPVNERGNGELLGGLFADTWKELMFKTHVVNENPATHEKYIEYREEGKSLPFDIKIFLPSNTADAFVSDAGQNPHLIEQVFNSLWPSFQERQVPVEFDHPIALLDMTTYEKEVQGTHLPNGKTLPRLGDISG